LSDIVIQVERLSKRYRIGKREGYLTLRDSLARSSKRVINLFRDKETGKSKAENNYIWALKDISFEVKKGEIIGIVGKNGAGKSTLLKILSRITEPTEGYAEICGRIGSLLEVGTGFHPELTGRENIYLNGAILGMKRAEIKSNFDEIVDFAEIEKFLDTPVKYYSSGMYVRLAFAVAAHLEAEILLVDEVLAVGDAAFQKKCLGKMGEVAREGRTVLFVSHSMPAVQSLCTRVILLEGGRVRLQGEVWSVIDTYLREIMDNKSAKASYYDDSAMPVQALRAELVPDAANKECLLFRCTYRVAKKLENLLLCVEIFNTSGISVFYANDESLRHPKKRDIGTHTVTLQIPVSLFAPGDYSVAYGFWEPGHAPVHFPEDRLWFPKEERITTRLTAHGIRWPAVIYLPFPKWEYVQVHNPVKKGQ
jgi:lipopolysaccharide transport system ATP-binding protein